MKSFFAIFITVFLFSCTDRSKPERNKLLNGMYKLYVIEYKDPAGIWQQQDWGKGGDGYIVYDGIGHMGVQITQKDYKDFQWLDEESSINNEKVKSKTDSMSVDELKAAVKEFSSSYVYFGNYSVSDSADIVTHYRISSSIPVVWGTTVQRKFSFIGDTIILEPINANRRLKWIKVK